MRLSPPWARQQRSFALSLQVICGHFGATFASRNSRSNFITVSRGRLVRDAIDRRVVPSVPYEIPVARLIMAWPNAVHRTAACQNQQSECAPARNRPEGGGRDCSSAIVDPQSSVAPRPSATVKMLRSVAARRDISPENACQTGSVPKPSAASPRLTPREPYPKTGRFPEIGNHRPSQHPPVSLLPAFPGHCNMSSLLVAWNARSPR